MLTLVFLFSAIFQLLKPEFGPNEILGCLLLFVVFDGVTFMCGYWLGESIKSE